MKARKDLEKFYVGVESMGSPQWTVARHIPAEADFKVVKQYIRDGRQAGGWRSSSTASSQQSGNAQSDDTGGP